MQVETSRRRFLGGAACWVGMGALLQGCGGDGASSASATSPPSASPAPTSTPTPTNAVTIAFAGSSSTDQYLTMYSGPADNQAVTASSDGLSFQVLSVGAFGKTAGTLINRALARPVRFLRGGVSGTTLAQWTAGNSPQRAQLVRAIRAAGGVDVILVQVGRNDAYDLTIASTDAQAALLGNLIASLRSEAGVPNATVFIGGSQDMLGGTADQHRQLGEQRLAEVAVVASIANVRYGFSTYDLATADNIHQTEASQQVSGTRFAAQVIALLQGTSEQRGPRVADVTPVGPTQTDVRLLPGTGTDIMPATGIDGFEVVLDGDGGELAVTAAQRTGATTIRLTHDPRNGRQVRIGYAVDHDVSDTACLRDNSTNQLPAEPYLSGLI